MYSKRTYWQSLISVVILAIFAYLAIGSFGVAQQKKKLDDGRYELYKQYGNGKTETIVGNVDANGQWDGEVTITYENEGYEFSHKEIVTMKDGVRHGSSRLIYPDGRIEPYCYQYGERVGPEYCGEKSATVSSADNSAYSYFSYQLPWFEFKLEALGFDPGYIERFMDTLEVILYATEVTEEDFSDFYDAAIEVLEETPYDSIIVTNSELSIYNGIDLIMGHEFRLATLTSYARGDSNTYNVVTTVYPNYLLDLAVWGVTETHFEEFCHVYDSIMSSYDPIPYDDPFLLDSLDERMYRTLEIMYTEEEETEPVLKGITAELRSDRFGTIRTLGYRTLFPARKQALEKAVEQIPQQVAEIVLYTILEQFIYGDFIRNAVWETFALNNGVVMLPTVTTGFSDHLSSTSVTLSGNVIEDGGGEVTARGMAWGTVYNPSVDNQTVASGAGAGVYTVTLIGLNEGETYYARAYAINSAGIAYGNCISFVAESTIGVENAVQQDHGISIFPNPASHQVMLKLEDGNREDLVFTLFDMSGRVVLRRELGSIAPGVAVIPVSLDGAENGIYSCAISEGKRVLTSQKLLISR